MKYCTSNCWLVAGAVAMLTSCSRQPPPTTPPAVKVTVSQPQTETVTNWDEYPGHIEAVEMVEIRPRVAGYIESVHFRDGAEVKAGDLLFVIDPRPYQAELDHAQAQRQQAESHLNLARVDFKRAETLRGIKAVSEEEYDNRHSAMIEAEAALAAARAAEETARINLDYTRIKAPVSGKIGRRLVTPGNFVQLQASNGSATLLAMIVSVDPIYCYFDVEEGTFLKYRDNAKASPRSDLADRGLGCELGLVNEEGFGHRGRVDFSDNQVNPQTGTIRLRAVFENATRDLVPGMFARVRVPAGPPEQALLISDLAVLSDQGYKFVYVVNQTNGVESRSIQTGRAHGGMRTVLKGLGAEDRVVVNGLMMLRPGVKVEAQSQQPEAGSQRSEAGSPKTTVRGPES